ncbi:glycosyltransferase family 4 protein [Spirulina subsalsa FACHB-351]|uniref:Glycosyltransferase family 4 protein n=1 Tax=Spirulina subsalsa FACHB-351 TaxID=234711 RepID=A0ABT3L932_9CYAN|nr:glycosyltransferase family 4 protein [Spirulina subsalsa]MCW6038013.1 glycosyltransferase family 4 protein [Spirulina subsalsa FACHB-351]
MKSGLDIVLISLSGLLGFSITYLIKEYLGQKLIDIPNDRSSHQNPTPRGGGLGFIVAFLLTNISTPFFHTLNTPNFTPIWLILTPLGIIGFLDDRYNLPARLRYLVQLSAAAIAIYAFSSLPIPGLNTLGLTGQVIGIVITAIAFTALINFYNFMDGLDGLVASVTALQLAFLALYLHQPLWWLLVAALLGFLYWNWSPAKIFMGDVGSTVLGACIGIALLNSPNPTQLWSALPITFPLIGDAIYTLIRRLLKKENIFQAHRTHLYQRLQQSGWSHGKVAIAYLLLTALIALLISTLGRLGSLFSVGIVLGAIASGEIYLEMSKDNSR